MNKPEHYLVLEPDGELHWIQVTNRNLIGAAFRTAVNGPMEVVYLPYGFCCVVDEVGKVRKDPKPLNPLTSRFYPGSIYGDPLVGPVVFARIGLVDGDRDFIPLRDEDLARISLIIGKPIPEFFTAGIDEQF